MTVQWTYRGMASAMDPGAVVQIVQRAVGAGVDGAFGPETANRLVAAAQNAGSQELARQISAEFGTAGGFVGGKTLAIMLATVSNQGNLAEGIRNYEFVNVMGGGVPFVRGGTALTPNVANVTNPYTAQADPSKQPGTGTPGTGTGGKGVQPHTGGGGHSPPPTGGGGQPVNPLVRNPAGGPPAQGFVMPDWGWGLIVVGGALAVGGGVYWAVSRQKRNERQLESGYER